jgi:hypothetical protein
MPALLDRFIPRPDAGGRHEITIAAPATLVFEVAHDFDLMSVGPVRVIFRLRELLMGSTPDRALATLGLVADMSRIGWGCLAEDPGRYYVAGAVCQPWLADVQFRALPAAEFATYAGPGQVKIAWTLEAEPLGDERARFATETRAVATDAEARARFLRYWRRAGIGIIAIRMLVLPAVRREAERRWRARR